MQLWNSSTGQWSWIQPDFYLNNGTYTFTGLTPGVSYRASLSWYDGTWHDIYAWATPTQTPQITATNVTSSTITFNTVYPIQNVWGNRLQLWNSSTGQWSWIQPDFWLNDGAYTFTGLTPGTTYRASLSWYDGTWHDIFAWATTTATASGSDFDPIIRNLSTGCTGADVAQLQRALIWLGYLNDRTDGYYGNNTYNAVRAVEVSLGLTQDGIVTPDNWNVITNKWYAEKEDIIAYAPGGTPEQYKPYIGALKKKYPNWSFQFYNTGINWSSFVDSEFDVTKHYSLTQNTLWINDYYYTACPDWYHAKRVVVEHFGDPRNFLNTYNIFQFEQLSYNSSTQVISGVTSILDGSFMGNSTYPPYFINAATSSSVSPYHLSSKSRLEMGNNGCPLAFGTVSGYEGYYNYYNIGASGNNPLVNGAIFASNQNPAWTTIPIAITGGGVWIGNEFIMLGQDTMYGQKFDLVGTFYTHQYVQNIQAACDEGKGIFNGYNSMGTVSNSFVFKIPVFTNMPVIPTDLPH